MMGARPDILVIGVGNRFRGDDAIGPIVVDRLRANPPPRTAIVQSSGEAAELIDCWRDRDFVLMIDAAFSGAPPGTIHTLDAAAGTLPLEAFPTTTHSFGLAQAVELARVLDCLPERMIIIGIEGVSFEYGRSLSAPVAEVVDDVVRDINLHIQPHLERLRSTTGEEL
jgi:hydrogenase maturation protease